MMFSFQTACLLFVVSLVHIAVIIAISPMEERANEFLSSIDVESIVESAIVTETSPAGSSPQVLEENAETDLRSRDEQIPGFPGQLMPQQDNQDKPDDGPEVIAVAKPVKNEAEMQPAEAAALSQVYRERISLPEPVSEAAERLDSSPVEEAKVAPDQAIPKPETAEPVARKLREIRPVSRL